MSFLKYLNFFHEAVRMYRAKEIAELIIACGQNIESKNGLLCCYDPDGNINWSKEYYFETEYPISFVEIIQNKEAFIIAGVEEVSEREFNPFIIMVDIEGELVWYRQFKEISLSDRKILLSPFYSENFHLGFFDERSARSKIYFFDSEGGVLESIDVIPTYDSTFRITGMSSWGELLYVCGNEPREGAQSLNTGLLITLNINLAYISSEFFVHERGGLNFKGLFTLDDKVLLYGKLIENGQSFIIDASAQLIGIYDTDEGAEIECIFRHDQYLLQIENQEITSIYQDLTPEWSRLILLEDLKIDAFAHTTDVVFHGKQANFLGLLANNLDSCKTTDTTTIQYFVQEITSKYIEYLSEKIEATLLEDIKVEVSNVETETSNICDDEVPSTGTTINYNSLTSLQTPNFYLQAVGSTGNDSTAGIHLRWTFGGKLSENHLPKGNMASTQVNYNKPDDFVKIYRALYLPKIFTLNLTSPPQLVDSSQRLWVYKFNNNQRIFYVYFHNTLKYDQISNIINPLSDPAGFLSYYANEIIEIICRNDLYFACEPKVENISAMSSLQLEGLSVNENSNLLPYHLAYRKILSPQELNAGVKFYAENGKKIRFKAANCLVKRIDFEFYSDFITQTNQIQGWNKVDDFALVVDTAIAVERLEPSPQAVDNKWLRYNDGAKVRIANYIHKWERTTNPQDPLDKDIKDIVAKYVELSNYQLNPKANETLNINFIDPSSTGNIHITNAPPEPGDMEVSYLDLLNIAALDYHVARMLGLGHLETGGNIMNGEYIYLAEYYTNANLDISSSDKNFQLISMSLPTSANIERLPLPVEIWKVVPGMENSPGSGNLYDINGYSFDGKKRFVSIYNHQVGETEINPAFFSSFHDFDASSFTNSVYAGIEYRHIFPGTVDSGVWVRPELSHDTTYTNSDGSLETVPIQIPDYNVALFMHKQERSGTYVYATYGINWFSRATTGGEIAIETDLKPTNNLLPPTGCQSFLVQKEYPLMFTSAEEQQRYVAIAGSDKTLVRLLFDYHIFQDEQIYQIPADSPNPHQFVTDTTSLYPDAEEVLADDIEIYFRNFPPKTITAQVSKVGNNYNVVPHPTNQLLAVINTMDYPVPSSAVPHPTNPGQVSYTEVWKSEIPVGTTINSFIGGILQLGNDPYIIHQITPTSTGLTFTVYKKDVSAAIMAGNSNPSVSATNLSLPVIDPNTGGIFNATENLQNLSNWDTTNPNVVKVKIGDHSWPVHRELFQTIQSNGSIEKFIQKSRGIWHHGTVEMVFSPIYEYHKANGEIIKYFNPFNNNDPHNSTYPPAPIIHQGIYKVTLNNFSLPDHSQTSVAGNSVEWHKGYVRLFTNEAFGGVGDPIPSQPRTSFRVVRSENIGSNANGDTILYVVDENFEIEVDSSSNPIFVIEGNSYISKATDPVLGNSIQVNYYPSYRVYLYQDSANNLTNNAIMPSAPELVKYSIFAFKAVDNDTLDLQGNKYKSAFSIPCTLAAQRIIEPLKPEQPSGSTFATRPDKFGKSTYSIITKFQHIPYSVLFLRADNNILLNAIYSEQTVQLIKDNLILLGNENELFFNDRWQNFVDFETLETEGHYRYYPAPAPAGENYRFPLPDKTSFFEEINAFINYHNQRFGTTNPLVDQSTYGNINLNAIIIAAVSNQNMDIKLANFVQEKLENCFLPLTEIPIIYSHVKSLSSGHRPVNVKQNIRDKNGYLLQPNDPDFAMAPMMTILNTQTSETLFTDFTLDGTSDNFYFYAAREVGSQMSMSEFSKITGPVRLVNTNPAEPPKIMSLQPILENRALGIASKVRVEINRYPEVQKINKISLYRTDNRLTAESILSMKLIKTVDINDVDVDQTTGTWSIYDHFEDLPEVPYSDPLFYRISVSRQVEYDTTDYLTGNPNSIEVVEQAPSMPSKITITTMVETSNPAAPILNFNSDPITGDYIHNGSFEWNKVCYKGVYHLYKMSDKGNWKEIARVNTDKNDTQLAHLLLLDETTGNWLSHDTLNILNGTLSLELSKLNLDPLLIVDMEGNRIYHHFNLVAENTANMFSTDENIMTV